MATETTLPPSISPTSLPLPPLPATAVLPTSPLRRAALEPPPILTTVHAFPSLEPLRYAFHPAAHLGEPLRKDILHRAVVFEADGARQGTASSKHRTQVRGSSRKIRPQKGHGGARLGDKKSPMLRGGGVAHGPHPRDFATKLPRKLYDRAWRVALSYRYARGELVVVREGGLEFRDTSEPRWVKTVWEGHGWGKREGNVKGEGRVLCVTSEQRKNLFAAMEGAGDMGRAKTVKEVDVRQLLGMGRILVEEGALQKMLREHSSDIARTLPKAQSAKEAEAPRRKKVPKPSAKKVPAPASTSTSVSPS